MTGVAGVLASLAGGAPVQRVRNYYLTDREASPRPRDFLTAVRRSDGALCLRWAGPPGDCLVRYLPDDSDADWECVRHNRLRGRKTVERVEIDRVREWLRDGRPELLVREAVRGAFEGECAGVAADAGRPAAIADGGRPDDARRVRVECYADLLDDPDLDRPDAEALAAALPAPPGEVVFRLPRVLAAESVLESVPGSDCVFVAEPVPERETDCAHYVRQDRRGCWVPKGEATAYELADGATMDFDPTESEPADSEPTGSDPIDSDPTDSRGPPESA